MALAFMLLVGAGLVTRSLGRVLKVDPGFEPSRLLTMVVHASGPRYQTDTAVWQMQERIVAAIHTLPEAQSAAIASQIPLTGSMDTYGVAIQGRVLPNPADAPDADRFTVSTEYLETMGVRVAAGPRIRTWRSARGGEGGAHQRVPGETRMAGADPIGESIQMGGPDGAFPHHRGHRQRRPAQRPRSRPHAAILRAERAVDVVGKRLHAGGADSG